MGRGATKATGNPWFEARMEAAKRDWRLCSREGAAELLGMSVSAVADAELGLTKAMPVDKAILMADLYRNPAMLNHYCLNECPIGGRRPLSDQNVEIDRAAVKLVRALQSGAVERLKGRLLDIAEDGRITADEYAVFGEIVDELREVSKIISELEIIRDRTKVGAT